MRPMVAVLLAVVTSLAMVGVAAAGVDDQDCGDFPSQAAAQAHLEADRADPDVLDPNKDGQACETFRYAPAAAPTATTLTPATTTPKARPTSPAVATTMPMAHTGAATDRQGALAGLALTLGLLLVMVSYARMGGDRPMV